MDGTGAALSKQQPPKIDAIKATAARLGGITKADIESARRSRRFSIPRQAAMYVSRAHTKCSYPQIGRLFGDRDHSTVLFSYRKITALIAMSPRAGTADHLLLELVRGIERDLGLPETKSGLPSAEGPSAVLETAGES